MPPPLDASVLPPALPAEAGQVRDYQSVRSHSAQALQDALVRELAEETGARQIRVLAEFGMLDEYRPWYRNDIDVMFMRSYCYLCQIDGELGTPQLEDYEHANGMQVQWVNIFDAIAHNKAVMASESASTGLSIVRETLLLETIAAECLIPCSV